LVELIERNTRPDRILVLVPQQAQAEPFRTALNQIQGRFKTRGQPEINTLYGLAYQHVSLFFPLVAGRAGFADIAREPTFINVELAQYFLNEIVTPHNAEFDDLRLYRPRLLSQILDSMNKAAECGFSLDEIAERLGTAWSGESRRVVSYKRAQDIALLFRQFCLEHSLLDFSLLIECYANHLANTPTYHDYIAARYRHIIADNVEENPPVMHDFLRQILSTCDSAILAQDDPGGYRLFLGADPVSARALADQCHEVITHTGSFTANSANVAFVSAISAQFGSATAVAPAIKQSAKDIITGKFWANMVTGVVSDIVKRVNAGVAASDIAVLAPYVEDVLRFELSEQLAKAKIALRVVRPSRPLYDHPLTRTLITLAKLAHPQWEMTLTASELARALATCIAGLDVARAQLIAEVVIKTNTQGLAELSDAATWDRVGMRFFERYHELQRWLSLAKDAIAPMPIDLFWQQCFSQVLSRSGFGLYESPNGATACDKLIRSARHFREVIAQHMPDQPAEKMATAYLTMLAEGIMAAQYVPERQESQPAEEKNAVLLAPVYTYLTNNFRSRYQYWLDINSLGWYERIHQPLTHPYVLSRQWQRGNVWTEMHEHEARRVMLMRVVQGLAYRCSDDIVFASSQLGISGQEEVGPLARAIQRVIISQT
jgi:hypothetical protein